MSAQADLMVVSATPGEALQREWTEHGLAEYMSVIAGQEMGSKAQHVQYAATGKYAADRILLIGDAPGDRDAARTAGCLYYPINPHGEAALIAEFEALLPDTPPWATG